MQLWSWTFEAGLGHQDVNVFVFFSSHLEKQNRSPDLVISLWGPFMKWNALRTAFPVGSDVKSGVLVAKGCRSLFVR